MSPEFQGSSKHEPSKLYSLESSTIRGFAERTDNQALLERLQYVVAERALGNEFDDEAHDVAIFIDKKLEALRAKDRQAVLDMEAEVKRLVERDYMEERRFCEVYPYFYQEDDPAIAQLERQHEALFKQQ